MLPHLHLKAALFLGAAVFLVPVDSRAASPPHEHDALPNLDRRLENLRANAVFRAAAAPQARADAEALLRSRLPDLQIERHEILHSPKWVSARDGLLTGRNGVGRGAGADIVAAGAGIARR